MQLIVFWIPDYYFLMEIKLLTKRFYLLGKLTLLSLLVFKIMRVYLNDSYNVSVFSGNIIIVIICIR